MQDILLKSEWINQTNRRTKSQYKTQIKTNCKTKIKMYSTCPNIQWSLKTEVSVKVSLSVSIPAIHLALKVSFNSSSTVGWFTGRWGQRHASGGEIRVIGRRTWAVHWGSSVRRTLPTRWPAPRTREWPARSGWAGVGWSCPVAQRRTAAARCRPAAVAERRAATDRVPAGRRIPSPPACSIT